MNNQIETIATIIYDELCECVRIRGFGSCDFCECLNEEKDCNIGHRIAKAIYNAGYCKVDEEKYKKYLATKSIETNLIEIEKDKSRKETAREILQYLWNFDPNNLIEELAEEYGVEVE